MLGSTRPRLWTPPLRDLSEPGASFGPLLIDYADEVLGAPFDPWQRWLAVHAGELLPDGRPRFRIVLLLVARQNGKTHVLVVLSLWWTFVEALPLILGTSTKLQYAKESWLKAVQLAERAPGLAGIVPAKRRSWLRQANGEVQWEINGSRYLIAPANEEGGRSLSLDALILDELRQHDSYAAWNAAVPAMEARPMAQAWALSNMGDETSVVLNAERAAALRFIETGRGDPRVGIFEWSAPPEADPTDLDAIAAANPNAGRRLDLDNIANRAATAVELGGQALTGFRTETLCQYVPLLDPAVDLGRWGAGKREQVDLSGYRGRVALAVDVSPDQLHATAVAAAVRDDGVALVDTVASWTGPAAARAMADALPGLAEKIRPRAIGWLPSGPAAAAAADLADRNKPGGRRRPWPPPGILVEAIRGEVGAVCMAFAGDVTAWRIEHAGDPLLATHLAAAQKAWRGAVWVFDRPRDGGHVDAAYAAAAAVFLARTMPAPVGKPRIVRASSVT